MHHNQVGTFSNGDNRDYLFHGSTEDVAQTKNIRRHANANNRMLNYQTFDDYQHKLVSPEPQSFFHEFNENKIGNQYHPDYYHSRGIPIESDIVSGIDSGARNALGPQNSAFFHNHAQVNEFQPRDNAYQLSNRQNEISKMSLGGATYMSNRGSFTRNAHEEPVRSSRDGGMWNANTKMKMSKTKNTRDNEGNDRIWNYLTGQDNTTQHFGGPNENARITAGQTIAQTAQTSPFYFSRPVATRDQVKDDARENNRNDPMVEHIYTPSMSNSYGIGFDYYGV